MTEDGGHFRRHDAYVPRRLSAFGQGYTLFVRVMKIALPLAAVVILAVLFARLVAGNGGDTVAADDSERTVPGQIELTGAKYEGYDAGGHPYTVTADRAVRAAGDGTEVLFENPLADIALADGTWFAVRGKGGTFDHEKEILTLAGDVRFSHDSGHDMVLEKITVDLPTRTAVADVPVKVQGPFGTIDARNVKVIDAGARIVFGGPAVMKIVRLEAVKGKE